MGDDDDGAARLAAGALQQGQHLLAGLVVQRTGRLIAEQELRIFGEGARNGDALLFAARKLGREVVQPLAEADAFQRGFGVQRVAADLAGQLYVFQRRQVLHEVVELEDESDVIPPVLGQLFRGEPTDILPIEPDMALVAGVHAAEDVQQGGLACTGRPDDDAELALVHVKIQAVRCGDADTACLVVFGNIFKFHEVFHNASPCLGKSSLFQYNYTIIPTGWREKSPQIFKNFINL